MVLLTREQLEDRLAALHRASLELVRNLSLDMVLERIAEMAKRGAVRGKRAPKPGKRPGSGGAALSRVLRVPGALNAAIDLLGKRMLGGSTLVLVFANGLVLAVRWPAFSATIPEIVPIREVPMASALSFILMAVLLVGIVAYARVLGTRHIEEYV